MSEPSIHNILREDFPQTGEREWSSIASQELGEKKTLEDLIWQIDGLKFSPYYEEKNIKNLKYLKKFQSRPSQRFFFQTAWKNLPKIIVTDVSEGNNRALYCLNMGADGVLFDITQCIDVNINHLLDRIDWPACSISFYVGSDTKMATKIFTYADEKNYHLSKLTGSIFWSRLPANTEISNLIPRGFTAYHSLGITVPSDSVVQEISNSLQQGVYAMDAMANAGIPLKEAIENISLSFACSENFMVNIAKLKSVRLLWYQLSRAFGVNEYLPEKLHIHVRSEGATAKNFDPHGNMIKNTTNGLSAVLGGCDSLTLNAEEYTDEMMYRMALNVSNIFKEESHIDKVSDPLSGAYAIDTLVNEISQAAWKDFQNRMRS